MIIAIDGPAGSGKSTLAKLLATELGFHYLDTGAMYRAVAYRALQEGIDLTGGPELLAIATNEAIAFGQNGPNTVSIGGLDVTSVIRSKEVDKAVSPVSACPAVREALTEQQRIIGRSSNVVMEGRDIGTVVFPDAECKIYLDATPECRAQRRCLQNQERGVGSTDFKEIYDAIIARDIYDSTREVSPLRKADDAYYLDSSDLDIPQVLALMVDYAVSCGAQDPRVNQV